MASLTVRIDHRDKAALVDAVATRILHEIKPLLESSQAPTQGIRVLSVADAAARLEVSESTLRRLEGLNEIPRRRKLTHRRRVYLEHELEELPAARVKVQDNRTLSLAKLALKLGINEKTIQRMVKANQIPGPIEGRWLEREIDEWLLMRPTA